MSDAKSLRTKSQRDLLTSAHWGTYRVEVEGGKVKALHDFAEDPCPSPIGHGIVDVLDGPTRIRQPMIRRGWLEGGPGASTELRGADEFIPVDWDKANRIVANELKRVIQEFGNRAIYAGSYGWASAGRFHHAQGQLKRFLNLLGGSVRSVNTYSHAAAEVITPHVMGDFDMLVRSATSWASIAEHAELFVAFGGIPVKNGQVTSGGVGRHLQLLGMQQAQQHGVQFVNVSPLQSDTHHSLNAEWIAPRPSSDTALMLALSHSLLVDNLHDKAFLAQYTTGFDRFSAYLRGDGSEPEKSADWAAQISELSADAIRDLARRMADKRTMIGVSWSLTRQENGEHAYWAAISLAAMLGQIGQPGTGIGFGYSAENFVGGSARQLQMARMPQGKNPISDFIPVARVTEMLEKPGSPYDFNGERRTYPDIRLIWWAGGNPFHHHQDLNRFRRALNKCETLIVNEWCWNATAKHADILLPCNTTLERQDLALNPRDPIQVFMDQAIEPVGQSKSDHDIFKGIAAKLGVEKAFTEGRSTEEWLRHLYDRTRDMTAEAGVVLPTWNEFEDMGWFEIPALEDENVLLADFRKDPDTHALSTPSGRIELFSEKVAGFGYTDHPGHAAWIEPTEWLGAKRAGELHLISNQPKAKLHSQLDHGSVSQAARDRGYEPLQMHPEDASSRGLENGALIRVFNDRGAFLARLKTSKKIRPGVVQVSTGAWFDWERNTCSAGNPNVVTRDVGTSRLAQGPSAHTCLVRVEGAAELL